MNPAWPFQSMCSWNPDKNYDQKVIFSLWLCLHLHEILFLITLSLVNFIFAKIQSKSNDRMTWNDALASLALDLVILLSIIFICSSCSNSFSYLELVIAPLLLLLEFCVAWTNYALSKQHGQDSSSCNRLNLNGQQRQRQVKKGGKEAESVKTDIPGSIHLIPLKLYRSQCVC